MDVMLGHCWRCEERISNDVICRSCGVAKYCTERCRLRDQYRHNPECEEWGPKSCANPTCSLSGQLKECSACNNAWYCGDTCQRQHWKEHKRSCRVDTETIQTAGIKLREKFKILTGSPLICPYYIGNTLAVDMLNLPTNECSETGNSEENDPMNSDYAILSAGCGNLRNWIHTVASLPKAFTGKLHTVLNDFDPFMQARNVLHLYMIVARPEEDEIAVTITTIWYSLHLPEKDYTFLVDCLTTLRGITASALSEVTGGVVQLSEADLSPMKEVWQGWLDLECRRGYPNYIDLRQQRQQVFKNSLNATEGIQVYREEIPREFLKSYDKYLETGDFLPSSDLHHRNLKYDNPTMTGYKFSRGLNKAKTICGILASPKKQAFIYCIEDDLSPFGSWDYLKVIKHHYNKSMVVMFHRYISDQIKQVIKRSKAKQLTTPIIIWNCFKLQTRLDIQLCKFDRIFTSNIADYSGTQPLLKAMKPLLNCDNKCATIVTQYWNWFDMFPSARVDHLASEDSKHRTAVHSCLLAAVRDVNSDAEDKMFDIPKVMFCEYQKALLKGTFFLQEYFNYMVWFVWYLRAESIAFNAPLGESHSKQVPNFQKVKATEGLRLRDFRRGELNKVVPFHYRRNVRQVNCFRGVDRMLEWYCL